MVEHCGPPLKRVFLIEKDSNKQEFTTMLQMNRLLKKIRALPSSLQNMKELQALPFTNKAATLAKPLGIRNFRSNKHLTSVTFRCTCANDPILISEVLSGHFASSLAIITSDIHLVASLPFLRFSFYPSDIKPQMTKIKSPFHDRIDLPQPSPNVSVQTCLYCCSAYLTLT